MKGTFPYKGSSFDMNEYSKWTPLQKAHKLLPISIDDSFKQSFEYIEKEFTDNKKYSTALEFIEYNVPEIISVTERYTGILSNELEITINRSLYLAYSSFCKEAICNLRSALELSLLLAKFHLQIKNVKMNGNFQYTSKEDFTKVMELFFLEENKCHINNPALSEKYKNDIQLLKQFQSEKDKIYNEIREWLASKSSMPFKDNFRDNKPRKNTFAEFFNAHKNFLAVS